ncbi:Sugar phosphate exchanger 2, putative [Fagus crenata]
MALQMGRIPATRRISDVFVQSSDEEASFSDMLFGFLEEGHNLSGNSSNSDNNDEEDDESLYNVEESKAFWKEQDQNLQGILYRTSSIETKIRQTTKEALREFSAADNQCLCSRPVAGGCRNCLRREVCNRLINVGYNCAICKSKWRSSPDIPSGEHTYLEVLDNSNPKKGVVRVIIELNFRAEFEMARASEDYNQLICRLPEVFIGKSERLGALIKILCSAAKKCMKEKKMHLGPWRKQKYMQAKWLGTCERIKPVKLPLGFSDRQPKPRASMLTFDLLESLPGLHCSSTAVAVV